MSPNGLTGTKNTPTFYPELLLLSNPIIQLQWIVSDVMILKKGADYDNRKEWVRMKWAVIH